MLYWFRTPPGVKVGRAALDEEAIRLIEQLNPGIEFDWTRILKGQGAPPAEARPPVDSRRQRPDSRRPRPSQTPTPSRSVQPPVSGGTVKIGTAEPPSVAAEPEPRPAVQSASGGSTEELLREGLPSETPTPAHAKLGAEGVERLRARYAEMLARISERTADPLRREELKLQADRLNPDAWVTSEEVVQGLEQYESVFASLREVVGQNRRRRRRGPTPQAGPGGAGGDAPDSAGTKSAAGSDPGEASASPEGNQDDGDSAPGES